MLSMIFGAAMTLVLSDGQKLETPISLSNPTRIIFESDRPTKLIFNEADTNAPKIAATLGTTGDVFITVEQGLVGQSISGFVTTESDKTYPVKFKISSGETDQVTIASSELRAQEKKTAAAKVDETPVERVEWNHASSYTGNMGNLIKILYRQQVPEGFKEKRASSLDSFGNEQFIATPYKRYIADNIEARVYVVRGVGGHSVYIPTHINEVPEYMAVSYTRETVSTGEQALLFVVVERERG